MREESGLTAFPVYKGRAGKRSGEPVQTPFKNAVARLRNFQRIIVPQMPLKSLSAFEADYRLV
jgi:hypothetical protein